jgi:ribosomal protein S18 acetylase RimI-like enzyme
MRHVLIVASHILRLVGTGAAALGAALLVFWVFDSSALDASATILVAAAVAIGSAAVALWCGSILAHVARQRLTEIVPFAPEHGQAFYALNRAWLDAHELYEPPDEAQLSDPEHEIIGLGGAVFIALRDGEVVGTSAVAPHGTDEVELLKLTVSESARGTGLGRRLVERCIEHARQSSARRMVLVSSSKLGAALRLYESLGFEHRPLPATVPYATADVFMELELQEDRRTGGQEDRRTGG